MTKLCPRGKAAAKRKFKVYPSAYPNAYASKICAGKIKSGKQMIKEGQKARKNLIDTKRAFQFKHSKGAHAIKPGEDPNVKGIPYFDSNLICSNSAVFPLSFPAALSKAL